MAKQKTYTRTAESKIEILFLPDRKARPYHATVWVGGGLAGFCTSAYATHAAAREAGIALAENLGLGRALPIYGQPKYSRA